MKSPRMHSEPRSPMWWIVAILMVNTVAVDAFIIHQLFVKGAVLGTTSTETCPSACIARINQVAGKTSTATAKEYYVPLGSGASAAGEWTDVAGASAYIDTSSYGKIKQVKFEATVAIPAGSQTVWARLYNATDKHPVWYSDVTTDQSGAVLLASPAIALDSGNKLYQVQMKTQLKILTSLSQARVKITTY